jgi:hypothetical protein
MGCLRKWPCLAGRRQAALGHRHVGLAGRGRTSVESKIGIQHWMVLAFLFYLDVVVLGCLFLIAMNKIYLLP